MRILLTCVFLAGCATQTPAPISDSGCSWATPMTASSADTVTTKREIYAFMLARQKNCPKS